MQQKCIIYTRVSSVRQTKEGNGLSSQEQRCRSHAREKGWDVIKVFSDGAVSGGILDRPGVQKMFEFLAVKNDNFIVLADDISRFARDNLVFALLKKTFTDLQSQMQTVNLHMEDSPEGDLIQAIMSSAAAYERQKNRLQVIARIKSRLELGYWVFRTPPLGYKYQHTRGHGKIATPDGLNSEVVRKTIEAVANGKIIGQTEIAKFMTAQGLLDKQGNPKQATLNITKRTIENAWFYAGFIEYKPWGISRRRGQHKPIISLQTYEDLQERYTVRSHRFSREITKQKFPLRGLLYCGECDKAMYAYYVGGRNSRYAYYFCGHRDCSCYRKNLRREEMHDRFKEYLKSLQPDQETLIEFEQEIFTEWEKKAFNKDDAQEELQKHLQRLEQQMDAVIESLANAPSENVQKAFYKRIERLEVEKAKLQEDMKLIEKEDTSNFPAELEQVCDFFRNLSKSWENSDYSGKRALINGLFNNELTFSKNEGFRNRENPLLARLTRGYSTSNSHMVEVAGIEPASEI